MIEYIVLLVVGLAAGFGAGLMIKGKTAAGKIKDAEAEAARIITNAEREAETKRKESVLEAKDKFYQARADFEKENARQAAGASEPGATAYPEGRKSRKEDGPDRETGRGRGPA